MQSVAAVDLAYGRPAAGLWPMVERYVGYRMTGFPPGVHRGMPGRRLTFIISLAEPVETIETTEPPARSHLPVDGRVERGTSVVGRHQAFVAGLSLDHALIRHDGNQYGIAVELGPLACRPLFGLPAEALGGAIVELDELLGRRGAHLAERLSAAPDWPSRFALLDAVLSTALGRSAPPHALALRHAWGRLVDVRVSHPVAELAAELGWSRRHLGALVRREVGLAPSQLRRVARFEHSSQLLAAAVLGAAGGSTVRQLTLADIALRSGYFDQAHLNREWRQLAGCSPLAWLAEEGLPLVRGFEGGPGAELDPLEHQPH